MNPEYNEYSYYFNPEGYNSNCPDRNKETELLMPDDYIEPVEPDNFTEDFSE